MHFRGPVLPECLSQRDFRAISAVPKTPLARPSPHHSIRRFRIMSSRAATAPDAWRFSSRYSARSICTPGITCPSDASQDRAQRQRPIDHLPCPKIRAGTLTYALTRLNHGLIESSLSAGAARGIRTPDPIITNDVVAVGSSPPMSVCALMNSSIRAASTCARSCAM
jgi:hypothetical protein